VMMMSRGVEISIAGGGEEMVRVLSLGRFFFYIYFFFYLYVFFFSFFLLSCVMCFRYKKPYAARAMKRKKPISLITTARFTSS